MAWNEKIEYDDGEVDEHGKAGELRRKRSKNKPGKYKLESDRSGLSLPVDRRARVKTTELPNRINGGTYLKVEVDSPASVTYLVSDSLVIRAEDPNDTTFEKEYNGDSIN